jgi:hypothetical protein
MLRLRVLVGISLLCLVASSASAYTVAYVSDADFLANGNFTKYFNANVRWGSGTASGDWEYSLMNGAETTTFGVEQQHDWVENGGLGDTNPHSYLLDWDDGTGVASLSISLEIPVSSTTPPGVGTVNALAIRAKASGVNGEAVTLTSPITISFDDDPGNPLVVGPLVGDANAEYIVIVDSRLGGGFDVTGAASIFKDDGSPPPEGSEPQYGFKVGFVPEPGTALLLGCGLALLAGVRRRARG